MEKMRDGGGRTRTYLSRIMDFLIDKASAEQLLAFRVSETAQEHADALTEKNKNGTLSAAEQAELAQIMEFHLLVTALKARAAKALSRHISWNLS